MATVINKQKIVNQLFTVLGKNAKAKPEERPVLEQFIYAIVRENTTREIADAVFKNLRCQFFDWNEVRVSSAMELAELMPDLPDAETRAQRIIDFLQEIFETTYSFDLDPLLEVLEKKGLKHASKQLLRYQAANDYSVAWVMQASLGNHSIPLDSSSQRVLRRIGLIEEEMDPETQRTTLEQQIPRAKSVQFIDMISEVAFTHCVDDEPRCSRCALRGMCPGGADAKQPALASKKPR